MNNKDILLTGIPRSGTSLVCNILNEVKNCVALVEAMNVNDLIQIHSEIERYEKINEFFLESRMNILTKRSVKTKIINGATLDNTFSEAYQDGELRKNIIADGIIKIDKSLDQDFYLILKHPNAFTALLGELTKKFPCFAIIRNPLSILASWNTIDHPLNQGHAPIAEKLVPGMSEHLRRIADKYKRQVYLLSWYYEQYASYLDVDKVLKYEDIIDSGGSALSAITPQAGMLQKRMENRNINKIYSHKLMMNIGELLLSTDGAFWKFYDKMDVISLQEGLTSKNGHSVRA